MLLIRITEVTPTVMERMVKKVRPFFRISDLTAFLIQSNLLLPSKAKKSAFFNHVVCQKNRNIICETVDYRDPV